MILPPDVTYKPPAACWEGCEIMGLKVNLLYWPTSALQSNQSTTPPPTITPAPVVSAVVDGATLYSPSNYLIFSGLEAIDVAWGEDSLESTSTLGTYHSMVTLSFGQSELMSVNCASSTEPIDYRDFNTPVPWSIISKQFACFTITESHPGSEYDIGYTLEPFLAYPAELKTVVDPSWSSCSFILYKLWDPPSVLTPVSQLVPATSSAPSATPTPVAEPESTTPPSTSTPTSTPAVPIPTVNSTPTLTSPPDSASTPNSDPASGNSSTSSGDPATGDSSASSGNPLASDNEPTSGSDPAPNNDPASNSDPTSGDSFTSSGDPATGDSSSSSGDSLASNNDPTSSFDPTPSNYSASSNDSASIGGSSSSSGSPNNDPAPSSSGSEQQGTSPSAAIGGIIASMEGIDNTIESTVPGVIPALTGSIGLNFSTALTTWVQASTGSKDKNVGLMFYPLLGIAWRVCFGAVAILR
jgi:hypothetical protein